MNDEILKNLIDILHAAEEIQRFTHGYDIVDEMIVWKAVKNHLPILIKEVHEILNA